MGVPEPLYKATWCCRRHTGRVACSGGSVFVNHTRIMVQAHTSVPDQSNSLDS